MPPIAESYIRQKQFVTDAGHELKTPLTVISANNELLRMLYGDSEWFDGIDRQVAKMNGLVQNLIHARGRLITFDIAEDVSYTGDESLLRQLVSILVDNAAKYCAEKGKIAVHLKTDRQIRLQRKRSPAASVSAGDFISLHFTHIFLPPMADIPYSRLLYSSVISSTLVSLGLPGLQASS